MKKKRNYKFAILNRIARYGKPIIDIWEKPKIKYYASLPQKHQPVFIIGAPRTGSTILYQLITNYLDVIYVDNLIDIFHKNLFFGFWLSNKIFKNKQHNCFKSYHGSTYQYGGLHAPSECGGFWYRWLPKDRHYIAKGEIPNDSLKEIRNNILSIINKFNKPLLFKNMNAALRMGMINEIFPKAKYIFIKRNPFYCAQSILITRKYLFNNYNKWWSLMPKNYNKIIKKFPIEQVVNQIYYIEKQIEKDKKLFPENNILSVNYGSLNKEPFNIIDKIKDFVEVNYREDDFSKIKGVINFQNNKKINQDIFNKIIKEVDKFDWKNYKS